MENHSTGPAEKPTNGKSGFAALAAAAVLSLLIPWLDVALKTYAAQSASIYQFATVNPLAITVIRLIIPLLFGFILAASLISLYRANDKLACGIALAFSAASLALFVLGILGVVRVAPFIDPTAYYWPAMALCAYLYTFICLCIRKHQMAGKQ